MGLRRSIERKIAPLAILLRKKEIDLTASAFLSDLVAARYTGDNAGTKVLESLPHIVKSKGLHLPQVLAAAVNTAYETDGFVKNYTPREAYLGYVWYLRLEQLRSDESANKMNWWDVAEKEIRLKTQGERIDINRLFDTLKVFRNPLLEI